MRLLKITIISFFFLAFGHVVAGEKCHSESMKTKDIVSCIQVSQEIIDGMLNDRYKVILGKSDFPYKETLVKGERLWVAYRGSKCRYVYDSISPGMEAEIERESCILSLTYSRLLELIYIESSVKDVSLEKLARRAGWREKYESLDIGVMSSDEEAYFAKNCELVGRLYGEEKNNCLKRMRIQNL